MKLRTNFTPSELEKVAKGLEKAAAQQRSEIQPENPAEQEIMRRLDSAFKTMVNSLQDEFSAVLLDKEE